MQRNNAKQLRQNKPENKVFTVVPAPSDTIFEVGNAELYFNFTSTYQIEDRIINKRNRKLLDLFLLVLSSILPDNKKMDLAVVFAQYQDMLDADQDLREEIRLVVRELDTTGREVSLILQQIHQEDGLRQIEELCSKAKITLAKANVQFANLASKIPLNQYFRFNDHWRYVMQRFSFLAALIFFLESEKLALHSDVGNLLQVSIKEENGFHLDVEDYLSGLLQLASELSRLAVNSVTAGNYDLPIRISRFVSELNGGFRLLNLKNDSLRKRFDALKYDVKKIEEVVYDLSIRGLRSRSATITKGN